MKAIDLIIVGGGCAGLSLGRELALAEAKGQAVPRTLILEARPTFAADRTWCFWGPTAEAPDPRVEHHWSAWRFSSRKTTATPSTPHWTYQCLPARRFYDEACAQISASQAVSLENGVEVGAVERKHDGFRVTAGKKAWSSRMLIDARPPSAEAVSRSRMFQVFSGVEIECEAPLGRNRPVGLMEAMGTDAVSFHFDYVLPLDDHRLLVEATRFSPRMVDPDQLTADLDAAVRRQVRGSTYRVLRRENGLIPMGLPEMKTPHDPSFVIAGTAAGAVRPATGFAFQRIQRWARGCAKSLIQAGALRPQPRLGWGLRQMDALFLEVLRDQPARAPELFMALARHLPAETLVRFLSDKASVRDHFAVVQALPAGPFLLQLGRHLVSRPPPLKRERMPA